MKLLQINTQVNTGSTGRIAENIGLVLQEAGHESYMAFGRPSPKSNLTTIQIGKQLDVYAHGLKTLLTDKHGFGSKRGTIELIESVEKLQPDAIGLHNLHGYYINIEVLFNFLKSSGIPVLWTLFDCWAFTGHCTYFDDVGCEKWKTQCLQCPKSQNYPRSFVDGSEWNFKKKKELFTGLENMELLTHSHWLKSLVKQSFLKEYRVHVTPSAIDTSVFRPTQSELRDRYEIGDKKVILGCANIWTNRKGYHDFMQLNEKVDSSKYQIVMIGLNKMELAALPANIIGLERTESIKELAQWYSVAHVFLNATSQDNFPTTNLEALACGTPVITYNTGGSPEAIDHETGFVVDKGDIDGVIGCLNQLEGKNYDLMSQACRARALELYNKDTRYLDYLNIYEQLVYNA